MALTCSVAVCPLNRAAELQARLRRELPRMLTPEERWEEVKSAVQGKVATRAPANKKFKVGRGGDDAALAQLDALLY